MKQRYFWPTSRRRQLLLALTLIVGLGLRLWLWQRTPVHQAANDEVEYLAVARDLLAGRGWRFYDTYTWLRAPLYPMWLAGSMWLVGERLHLSALPNVALSSFTVYLYYLLGREIGAMGRGRDATLERAERVGVLTAGVAAVLLTLATFASLWMSETLFTALFVAALIVLLRATRPRSVRSRVVLVACAGVLLGLAILTRSLPMMLLPAIALWLLVQGRQPGTTLRLKPVALVAPAILVVATVLVIAPWSLRNYRAYGAFIPVETGLSYNLWWFNDPHEDEDTIYKTLVSIRNPAERADYATQKGLARLREDPAILVGNLWPNFNALWMVKPIEDRFLQRSYYEDVPVGLFAAVVVFDDLLYALLAVLGLCGLAFAPLDRRKVLLAGWLLYVVLVVVLTHGEGRYRHFIFPVLIPSAAWLLVGWRAMVRQHQLTMLRVLGTVAIIAAVLWTPLVKRYPFEWVSSNLRRGWFQQRATWAVKAGNIDQALQHYWRAHDIDRKSPDVLLAIGRLHLQRGAVDQALAAFDSAFLVARGYVSVNMQRGDALRRLGHLDEARRAFKGYYTREDDMLDWSWEHLDAPLPNRIDVGDGLDFGFVHGVYAAEQQLGETTRWTRDRAEIKLGGTPSGGTINLTLAAPRPDGQPVRGQICVSTVCRELVLEANWRTFKLVVPAASTYHVTLDVPTFSPQAFLPASPDERTLGIVVDQVSVSPFQITASP